jgi:hypothetical protein
MADKQVAMVIKIEYEIEENRDRIWTAYIMAYSQDEAVKYLAKFLRKTIKVSSLGIEAPRVDALSEEVRAGITGKKSKTALKAELDAEKKKIGKKGKKRVDIAPTPEELEKLNKTRERAIVDLKKQGVDIYEPPVVEEEKEEDKSFNFKKPIKLNVKK